MFGISIWEIVVIAALLGVPVLAALVVLAVTLAITRSKNRVLCPSCGQPVDAADNFCRRCGAALGRPQRPTSAADSEKGAIPD